MSGHKIVRLDVENVKRVSAVHIEADGSAMVVIGGKNGAGKSSVLDSIAYALGGKSLCPIRPIKDGADKATIRVDLGDLVIERVFTKTDSYLSVKNAQGFRGSSPQAILDSMVGKLSFDPLQFATMQPAELTTTLKEVVGVDFDALDEKRTAAYSERTQINRQMKVLKAQLNAIPEVQNVPEDLVSVSDLMTDLEDREEINRLNKGQREELRSYEDQVREIESGQEVLLARISELQKASTQQSEDLVKAVAAKEKAAKAVSQLEDVDTEEIRQQIVTADEINEQVRAKHVREGLAKRVTVEEEAGKSLSEKIKTIDKEKSRMLAEAHFPIEGLGFDEEGVVYNSIPFDQISQAEKLRVSVAMGLAMNPDLRVMLIRDGSLLDEENLALVSKMAEENDAQIWIERVGNGAEISVLIEDGTVKESEVKNPS